MDIRRVLKGMASAGEMPWFDKQALVRQLQLTKGAESSNGLLPKEDGVYQIEPDTRAELDRVYFRRNPKLAAYVKGLPEGEERDTGLAAALYKWKMKNQPIAHTPEELAATWKGQFNTNYTAAAMKEEEAAKRFREYYPDAYRKKTPVVPIRKSADMIAKRKEALVNQPMSVPNEVVFPIMEKSPTRGIDKFRAFNKPSLR